MRSSIRGKLSEGMTKAKWIEEIIRAAAREDGSRRSNRNESINLAGKPSRIGKES